MKPIYVIGHRNPDTDSICSAIAYAHLKHMKGEEAIPARCGQVNAETKFALDYFKMESPLLVSDFYPRVKDIAIENTIVVHQHDALRRLGEIMREHDLKSVPVTDSKGALVGIVTVSDLAQRYFQELGMQDLADMRVRYRDIIHAVDGDVLIGDTPDEFIEGAVKIAAGSIETIRERIHKNDIVLVGDRQEETLLVCLENDISCLVITGGVSDVSDKVIETAKKYNTYVMTTPYDTYTAARLVNQCVPVRRIMHESPVTFKPLQLLNDIKETMHNTNFRNYPVVENGKLIGIVSRDSLHVEKERVILVDHNERSQAVEGIEDVKVIEIIDHHRLGGMQTSEPIYTHQEPVGCTATIIANMYRRRDFDIPREIAGLLLSAIISDTVLFKSPTCTDYDKETAERLAKIAGVDIQEYGLAMLKAGSGIGDMTPAEIVKNDMKEFVIGDYRIIVSQISVMDTKEVMDIESEIVASMKAICQKDSYDMSLVMVTNIIEEATTLLFSGSPKTLISEAFHQGAEGTNIYLPGVMSRKKQIIPPLSEAVKRLKGE